MRTVDHTLMWCRLTIGRTWLMPAAAGADRSAPLPVLRRKHLAVQVGLLPD
jgi:hypothetical protein